MTVEQYAKWLLSMPEEIRKMQFGIGSRRTDDNFIAAPDHCITMTEDGQRMLMAFESYGDDPLPTRLSKQRPKTSLQELMQK